MSCTSHTVEFGGLLTGAGHFNPDQPDRVWLTHTWMLGEFPVGNILQHSPDSNFPTIAIQSLTNPRDVIEHGGNLYVADGVAGAVQVRSFPIAQLPAFATKGTVVFSDDAAEIGQIACTGDWLLVASGDTIYRQSLLDSGDKVPLVTNIVGSRAFYISETSDPNSIDLYFIHSGTLRQQSVTLNNPTTEAAEAVPAGANVPANTGLMGAIGNFLLLPHTDDESGKLTVMRLDDIEAAGELLDIECEVAVQAISGAESGRTMMIGPQSYCLCELGPAEESLVMGIGFVPISYIVQDNAPTLGRANTMDVPNYFFRVNDSPFGGSIHLIISHKLALQNNPQIASYKVWLGGVPIMSGYTDFKRSDGIVKVWEPVPISHGANGYPVRDVINEQWYSPTRGAIINTRLVADGIQDLEVVFYDGEGVEVLSNSLKLLIDNRNASAKLELPRIGGNEPAMQCGCLTYQDKSDSFEFDFLASHPDDEANYSLALYRGSAYLPSPISESGEVSANMQLKGGLTVSDIMGSCNVANVRIYLNVPTKIINGYRYIYRAHTGRNFTLVPNSIDLEG